MLVCLTLKDDTAAEAAVSGTEMDRVLLDPLDCCALCRRVLVVGDSNGVDEIPLANIVVVI